VTDSLFDNWTENPKPYNSHIRASFEPSQSPVTHLLMRVGIAAGEVHGYFIS